MVAVIRTLEGLIEERVHRCTEELAAEFRASVRPVYATVDGNRPELVGSCLLLSIDDTKYIVTAAHVMDWTAAHSLHVVGSAGTLPVQILGKVTGTAAPNNDRQADKIDVAFWPIPEAKAAALGNIKFINETSASAYQFSPVGRVYMAIGCPISRNKGKVNHQQRSIKPTLWKYTSVAAELPALASELGVSGNEHIFLEYGKYATNRGGQRVSAVNPIGMSGGAIVDLGDFTSRDCLNPADKCVGHLAGMLIERSQKHRALVAIKIQKIVDAIRTHKNAV